MDIIEIPDADFQAKVKEWETKTPKDIPLPIETIFQELLDTLTGDHIDRARVLGHGINSAGNHWMVYE